MNIAEITDDELFATAVLFVFSSANYDGEEPIRPISLTNADILKNCHGLLTPDILNAAQKQKLIEHDPKKIGWIRLTADGLKKLNEQRDDFFDDEIEETLSIRLDAIFENVLVKKREHNNDGSLLSHRVAITASVDAPCPQSGWWKAGSTNASVWNLKGLEQTPPCFIKQGEPMPDLGTPSETPAERAANAAHLTWWFVRA